MSAAATTADPPKPSRVWCLLDLVRRLIDCGKELASALKQQGAAALRSHDCRFGTNDVALILARITRGLQLAAALHARILSGTASLETAPNPTRPASPRGPRALPVATPPPATVADPRLDALPTVAELARDIRRRPIGAVLADVCRDLGILPRHKLWRELQDAIIRFNGNYARLVIDIIARPSVALASAVEAASSPPPAAAPASTGPPP